MMLPPPSPAFGMLLGTMSQNKALADEFTENFNYPDTQWDRISTPERIHAWIGRMSAPAEPCAPSREDRSMRCLTMDAYVACRD